MSRAGGRVDERMSDPREAMRRDWDERAEADPWHYVLLRDPANWREEGARLVREALDRFEFHPRIEGMEVDFAHFASRLVLETDGWEFHGSRDAFERDRNRDLRLVAAGWRVMRITWLRLTEHPDQVADAIRRAMRIS